MHKHHKLDGIYFHFLKKCLFKSFSHSTRTEMILRKYKILFRESASPEIENIFVYFNSSLKNVDEDGGDC